MEVFGGYEDEITLKVTVPIAGVRVALPILSTHVVVSNSNAGDDVFARLGDGTVTTTVPAGGNLGGGIIPRGSDAPLKRKNHTHIFLIATAQVDVHLTFPSVERV